MHTVLPALSAPTRLPVFVISSLAFTRSTRPPSVLDSETFLTLTLLVNPDSTATIPILICMITFANAEPVKWFISDAQRNRQEKVEERNTVKRVHEDTVIESKKVVQNPLRVMSVEKVLVAAVEPGVCVHPSLPL